MVDEGAAIDPRSGSGSRSAKGASERVPGTAALATGTPLGGDPGSGAMAPCPPSEARVPPCRVRRRGGGSRSKAGGARSRSSWSDSDRLPGLARRPGSAADTAADPMPHPPAAADTSAAPTSPPPAAVDPPSDFPAGAFPERDADEGRGCRRRWTAVATGRKGAGSMTGSMAGSKLGSMRSSTDLAPPARKPPPAPISSSGPRRESSVRRIAGPMPRAATAAAAVLIPRPKTLPTSGSLTLQASTASSTSG